MALRSGHGNGAGVPRVEVLPADELPAPVPADEKPLTGVVRRQNGTVATSEAAKALGRRGGEVKAKAVRLARCLGLSVPTDDAVFAPYRRAAAAFRRHHCKELAAMAGGHCGAAASSIVASAALQLAASRFLFDLGAESGDATILKQASQLANDSRQNLLAAAELATRSASARRARTDDATPPWLLAEPEPDAAPAPRGRADRARMTIDTLDDENAPAAGEETP